MGWLDDWVKRIELTIDNTNVDSDLSNFPVLVYISAASGIGNVDASAVFDELSSDANRKKIAVTTSDGITQCYVEIERWDDANEKAWLWVKVPSILASGGATLYLYYDSTKVDNTSYVGDTTDAVTFNVWDSNFVFICHMAQDPNGDGANALKDSTSNAIHATPVGSMTSADLVDGKVGKAIDFDGSDDYLATASADDVLNITTTLTLECTFKPVNTLDSGLSDNIGLLTRQHRPSTGQDSYALQINTDGKFLVGTFGGNIQSTTASWAGSTWHYVAGTFNSSGLVGDLFANGVKETLSVDNYDSMTGATNSLAIGCLVNPTQFFYGIIDEVRISNIVRSDAWIKATHYSNKDDLITFGIEESIFIEDASLDLSAYGFTLENLQAFLRAHDGIELRDFQTALEAFSLSTEDFPTLLIAALESTGDFAADFETWATQYKDLAGDFDAKGQGVESLTARLETAKAKYKNLAAFLSVTDGSVLKDLAAFLSVTDGSILKNMGLYLKAVQSVPAFRSITAQRVSSVVHEVS